MIRKILHLDLDAFFCAVEEQRDPSLVGQPFAVGGRPDQRGVVASCSYPARTFGIHSAMPMARAVRLCPQLIVVPSRHQAYSTVSKQVMAQLHSMTPLVEQLSIDEAFLDVTDLPDPAEQLARQLQVTILDKLALPNSLGVATNKLVAKIANNVGKASALKGRTPNAITVVPAGHEAAFLAPLPVSELWGVGPKTAESLVRLGLHTIGDIARQPEKDLVRRFGKHGLDLARRAKGIDDRPVETEHEAKSISQETTFAQDVTDREKLRITLRRQSEQVGRRMRKAELFGSTVRLKIRWADFTTLTRQVTLTQPTQLDNEIYEHVLHLFDTVWPDGKRVRLIGVGVSNFDAPARQLELWGNNNEADQRLQDTLDTLRDRFGNQAIRRGNQLKKRRS
ncbi:MAG: DNA polymerase IV [Anaerolineae bacterium]|nr:DNA polymerase IV [Anaerolineae bacterium]